MAGLAKVKAIPVKVIGGGGPIPSADAEKREEEYRQEDDHRTLQRAEEVKRDPKRMKGAMAHHRRKLGEMAAVGETLAGKRTMGDKKRPAKFRMASGRARSGR